MPACAGREGAVMGKILRSLGVLVPALVFLLLAQGSAFAANADLESDYTTETSDLQNGAVASQSCGNYDPDDSPDVQDVVYRTISRPPLPPLQLKLDVYYANRPLGQQGQNFAAMVVAHGGGWYTGCKRWSDDFARDAAKAYPPSPGFIVFNIDYRLACTSSNDPLIGQYCGWKFAVPGDDVQAAVTWVRAHATDYLQTGQTFNGHVALFGSSAGGNLAFEGAMHATGSARPDAVAGWSGFPDLVDPNGVAYCDIDSFKPDWCDLATKNYVNCDLSICPSTWDNASPDFWIDSSDPPTFIGNARHELSPPSAAQEFAGHLTSHNVAFDICWVNAPGPPYPHGLGLRDWPCDDNNGTTWSRTMIWLDQHT